MTILELFYVLLCVAYVICFSMAVFGVVGPSFKVILLVGATVTAVCLAVMDFAIGTIAGTSFNFVLVAIWSFGSFGWGWHAVSAIRTWRQSVSRNSNSESSCSPNGR